MSAKHFSYENILLSILGHMLLISITITSYFVIDKNNFLIKDNRIKITEIDLTNIEITKEDTNLYNEDKNNKNKDIQETNINNKNNIKKLDKNLNENSEKKQDKIKKTLKVNRETSILKSKLSLSVIDALRYTLSKCWIIDTSIKGLENIRIVAHLKMNQKGYVKDVWFESEKQALTDKVFEYVLNTIKEAITICQPFDMLPKEQFEYWDKIQLTFYPNNGEIL